VILVCCVAMTAFVELFGSDLLTKEGKKPTTDVLAGKTGVFVYFSAHWCPPCRGFTPKFAEFHTKFADDKNFATIFVSSDKDQEAFDSYYGEQPWFALPYEDRSRKDSLSKKFKVQGIPSLVLLDGDGKLITKDGRTKVMENIETCDGYPWVPATFAEALGSEFERKDGSTVGLEAIAGKTLGLYFSAHWCPPCRGFTPKLKEFYEAYKAKDPNFEIVFVSSDKDEAGMKSYFKEDHGDYLALPFSQRQAKSDLSDMFGVQGIPTFVAIDDKGRVLNSNARSKVAAGADAVIKDGWEPAAVGDMAEGPEAAGTDINECPTVVAFCAKSSATEQAAILESMTQVAKRYIAAKGDDDPKYIFLMVKSQGGMVEQIQALTKKDGGEIGDAPTMLLFDIPDNGGFYKSDAKTITVETIDAFIKQKEDGSSKRLQLSRG